MVIIQETNKAIDQDFLQEEIYRRNHKFNDEASIYIGFKKEEIAKVLNDEFIIKKLEKFGIIQE